ncbi:MAG: hypothetical protein AAF546_08645 [Verrucomicrobiota bacterium]
MGSLLQEERAKASVMNEGSSSFKIPYLRRWLAGTFQSTAREFLLFNASAFVEFVANNDYYG